MPKTASGRRWEKRFASSRQRTRNEVSTSSDWDDLKSQTVRGGCKRSCQPSFSGDAEEIVYEADLDQGHGLVKVNIKSGEEKGADHRSV